MKPLDFQFDVLKQAMDLRLKRHSALASNIANADTPGYRPKEIIFEKELQRAVYQKSVSRLGEVTGKLLTVDDNVPRPDGNSVNMDKQMASLSENAIQYNATADFMARKFRMLKGVIG